MRWFTNEHRNIKLFYVITFGMSLYFMESNWYYFWTKFMTYKQLGIIDAIGFGFAMLMEIPSGAIADLLGRKKTVLIGMLAGVIGTVVIASAQDLNFIFVGWMITQIAYALHSGAAEALAYDTLVENKRESDFDQIISRSKSISILTEALAILVGGIMYVVWFRLPHYGWSVGFLIAAIASIGLIEPKIDTITFSLKSYVEQLFIGAKVLASKELRKFIIFIFLILGVYYMFTWGFIGPAMANSFGFFANEQSIVLTILTLIVAGAVRFVPEIKKHISDMGALTLLAAIMALSFAISALPIGYWGFFVLLAITMSAKIADPIISIVVNNNVPSKYRATTISTATFLTKLPYVFLAIMAGSSIQDNRLGLFNIGIAITIVIGIYISMAIGFFERRSKKA